LALSFSSLKRFRFYAATANVVRPLLCNGSYTSPLTHKWCSNTASFLAVAMIARLLPRQSRIYSVWGRTREERKVIDQLREISHHRYVYPTFFAGAYLAAGDKEQALTWMERAYDEKDPALFWLKIWPSNDLLRSEPRFQALLRKLNFPQ
jgi:hypothetical protein